MALQQKAKQKLYIGICLAAILALVLLLAFSGGNWDLLRKLFTQEYTNEEMQDLLGDFGWRGYVLIIVLSALQVLCTVMPAEPIQVLSGFTFGIPGGLALCVFGVTIGNVLIYVLQKTFGDKFRGFFIKKLHLDLEAISTSTKCMMIIFILYFLPAIPYGMICFFAAGTGMSFRRYFLVTLLGTIPSEALGVILGHMTISSNWIITLCTFIIIVLLLVIMFWKKDLLFSKLNNYAGKHQKSNTVKVRDMNGPLLGLVYHVCRFYFFLCGIRMKAIKKVKVPDKPSIFLCNHGSFIDFIYAAAILRKYKPNFIAARLYFYNKYLGWLLRKLGSFPKSMFATDLENAKNCLTVLREKDHLGMMPEARLSTVGRFEDIQDSTYSFIKKAGVSVYTLKFNGDYFADPKWGKGMRRGSMVEAEFDILYTAEQVQSLSLEELKQGIEQRLTYDEFQWLAEHPKQRYRSRRMAEGLENILTVCPICHGRHTIITKKDKVFCENCGQLTSVDDRYAFTGDFQFANFAQWYDWQKAYIEKEILENEAFALTSEVELRLPSNGKGLTRHGGYGVCSLNRDGLTYTGTKDGQEVSLHYSIQKIYRLLFGAGENFEVYDGTEIQYFVPKEKRSAVDWYVTSMLLHDMTSRK